MDKYLTFGEIMLRLKTPQQERFFQSPILEVTFGGGGANVAVWLARLGLEVSYVSVIPDNPIGEACLRELNKHGVETSSVLRQGERLVFISWKMVQTRGLLSLFMIVPIRLL